MTNVTGANRLLARNKTQSKPTAGSDGASRYQKPEAKSQPVAAKEKEDLTVSVPHDEPAGSEAEKDLTISGAKSESGDEHGHGADTKAAADPSANDSHRPFRWAEVPVSKIRSWRYKDRQAEEIQDDPSYQELLTLIESQGQLQDIGLRTLETPDGEVEYEEIFGFKRLNAKRELGHKTVTAKVYGVLSDVQAAILQAGENSGDSTPSVMSRADNYYSYIRDGVFKNGTTMAQMFGRDAKTVNNLIRIARQMPAECREALSLHKLPYPALFALVALTNPATGNGPDDEAIKLVVKHADSINQAPKSAVGVFNKIKAILNPETKGSEPRVLEIDGEPAMMLKRDRKGSVTISVPGEFGKNLDDAEVEKIFRKLLKK